MGKRRSSAHQRWAAGPGFKGKLESLLKTISHPQHEDPPPERSPDENVCISLKESFQLS